MKLSDAQNIYQQLLLNHGVLRHTPNYQSALCAMRDEICELTGRGQQEVQEEAEHQALMILYPEYAP